MDQYQQYIHKSRYARYLDEEGRRETWAETVNRYLSFFVERNQLGASEAEELFNAIAYALHDDSRASLTP